MSRLTLREYQVLAKRTCPNLGNDETNFLHMRLGIITEIGEVLDIFKKDLAYKKPIDKVNMGEELADICWYLVNWATFKNTKIEELVKYNVHIESPIELLAIMDNRLQEGQWNLRTCVAVIEKIAVKYGIDFEVILYKNIEKLKIRFPDKFTEEAALNRNTDEERKVLE